MVLTPKPKQVREQFNVKYETIKKMTTRKKMVYNIMMNLRLEEIL